MEGDTYVDDTQDDRDDSENRVCLRRQVRKLRRDTEDGDRIAEDGFTNLIIIT